MKVLICIPTYNEKENILSLLETIFSTAPTVSVLVIDDNSPDGTANLVKTAMQSNSQINILERPGKMGLGSAYICGFKYAIENNFDCAISMDADFSHHPKYLPNFIKTIENYDFIIGSRYVKSGGTVNWGLSRKIISRGGNIYANIFLGLPFLDLTGGFNCYRTNVLKTISLDTVGSEGYSFQIEMKYRCFKSGFNGVEIPIIFEDRRVGNSKMSSRIVFEAMLKVPLLLTFKPKKNS